MSIERINFINKYSYDVVKATQGSKIFPSVKMAQLLIESANSKGEPGKGITFIKANNGFGIKANKNYKGAKMLFNTPGDANKINYFRVYNSVQDSIIDHTNFLLTNKNYTKNGVFTAKTPEEQVLAIAKGGYAENPNYANAINKIITSYNLKKLDTAKFNADYTGLIFVSLGLFFLIYNK